MKRLLPLLLLSLLAGCASGPGPAVTLVNVQFTQATAFETTAQFTLRLNNSAPGPVSIDGAVHRIYINGLYVGEGLDNTALTIPRLTSATQPVTVHLNNLALATRIKAMIEARSFDYVIQSTFYGRSPSGRLKTRSEGRLDLRDFQPTPAPPPRAP